MNRMLPSVSVIIPLYNKERTIERAIRSIVTQSARPSEIIVVDDGSSDNSLEIAESLDIEEIVVVKQENSGPGAARNTGGLIAKGEILAFLDADDEWRPDYLKTGVTALEQNALAVAYCCGYDSGDYSHLVYNKVALVTPHAAVLPPPAHYLSENDIKHRLDALHSSCSIIRTHLFKRLGGFFERDKCKWGEDSYLWAQVLFSGPICWDPAPLVRYHIEDSELGYSITARSTERPIVLEEKALLQKIPSQHHHAFMKLARAVAGDDIQSLSRAGAFRKCLSLRRRFGYVTPIGIIKDAMRALVNM